MNVPPVPNRHNDMLSYSIKSTGEFPKTTHTTTFTYPGGTRTFDGRVWAACAWAGLPHKKEKS